MTSPAELSKVTTHSVGTTFLLKSLVDKVGLIDDLTSVYGTEAAGQLLSLAMFMTIDSLSALSLYSLWQRRFWVSSESDMPSQYTSRLLRMIVEDVTTLKVFFQARVKHVRASEYLSYDSTKIASTTMNINDIRWTPSKSSNF